jgi:hypothetical protein
LILNLSFDLCLRFANCFIKPVIEEAALEAEVEAIDSGMFHFNLVKLIYLFSVFKAKTYNLKSFTIINTEFCEEKDNQGRILECLRSHTLKQSHLYHNVFHCGMCIMMFFADSFFFIIYCIFEKLMIFYLFS